MSKAKQRRQSMYNLGRQDALKGLPVMWVKHPLLKIYKAGYNSVKKANKRLVL